MKFLGFVEHVKEIATAWEIVQRAGDILLDEMIAELRETGYLGPLSLELFNEEYWAQGPAHVVRTGWEKSRRFFA